MKEKVGTCTRCGRTIYCESGFLTGVVDHEGGLLCFTCLETDTENKI